MKNIKFERRRNHMSYMIAIKGKEGVIIASDSYSCYYNRELKDANYKKIHCIIPKHFYIGMTGINQIYNLEDELVDINCLLNDYFVDTTKENVYEQICKFAEILSKTCNRELKDFSGVFALDKEMYILNILHNKGVYIDKLAENELDIIFLGEEEHKYHARNEFRRDDMFKSVSYMTMKVLQSVANEIKYEAELYPENQRVVGGKVQYCVLKHY